METQLTNSALNNSKHSVLTDLQHPKAPLIVVFGGISGSLPIPVFEFMKSLNTYNVNKIFIRDFHQAWYLKGLKGVSNNFNETLNYLDGLINDYRKHKIIFMAILPADLVLCYLDGFWMWMKYMHFLPKPL